MATETGTRNTTQTELFDGINSQRLFGFDGLIADLVPDQAPFLTIFNKLARKTINDPDYKYTEYRASWLTRPSVYLGTALTCTASPSGTLFADTQLYDNPTTGSGEATTKVVANIRAGQVIQLVGQSSYADVPSQTASFMVKAPTTAGAGVFNLVLLNASPGFNGVGSGAGDTRSKIYVGGDIYGEGSEAGTAQYEADTIAWASAEITKERFTISQTLKKLVAAGNTTEAMKQYKRALARLKAKLERKLIYLSARYGAVATNPYSSPPTSIDSGGNPTNLIDADGNLIRTSISMLQASKDAYKRGMLETRVFSFTSSSTYAAMLANLQAQFKYGSGTKWGFVGDGMLSTIQALCAASTFMPQLRIQASQFDEKFGLNVSVLTSPFGEINLVRDRTLTQDGFYTNTMFVADPANIELLMYRDVDIYDLPTTKDAEDKEFRTEIGLAVKNPETHGFWYVG